MEILPSSLPILLPPTAILPASPLKRLPVLFHLPPPSHLQSLPSTEAPFPSFVTSHRHLTCLLSPLHQNFHPIVSYLLATISPASSCLHHSPLFILSYLLVAILPDSSSLHQSLPLVLFYLPAVIPHASSPLPKPPPYPFLSSHHHPTRLLFSPVKSPLHPLLSPYLHPTYLLSSPPQFLSIISYYLIVILLASSPLHRSPLPIFSLSPNCDHTYVLSPPLHPPPYSLLTPYCHPTHLFSHPPLPFISLPTSLRPSRPICRGCYLPLPSPFSTPPIPRCQ